MTPSHTHKHTHTHALTDKQTHVHTRTEWLPSSTEKEKQWAVRPELTPAKKKPPKKTMWIIAEFINMQKRAKESDA